MANHPIPESPETADNLVTVVKPDGTSIVESVADARREVRRGLAIPVAPGVIRRLAGRALHPADYQYLVDEFAALGAHQHLLAAGYETRLRSATDQIRLAHDLRAQDPLAAVGTLIRGARPAPAVGHGRGPALVPAAMCGGFSQAAQGLGGLRREYLGPSRPGDDRRAQAAHAHHGGGR